MLGTHLVQPLGDAVLPLLQQGLQRALLLQKLQTARVRLQHRLHRRCVVRHHLCSTTQGGALREGDPTRGQGDRGEERALSV